MGRRARRRRTPFELEVERLGPGGTGEGWREERLVRVRGAPPGARVEAIPFRRKGEAILARRGGLLRPPPGAVTPRCAAFGSCGGCTLQELPPARQRELRLDLARRLADPSPGARAGGIRAASPTWGYRNKVELTYGVRRHLPTPEAARREPVEGRWLGMHAPGRFDRIVDLRRCEIVPEGLNLLLERARAHLATTGPPPWDARRGVGFWRHLVLRQAGTGQRLAAIYTADPAGVPGARRAVEALGRALGDADTVAWHVNPRTGDAAVGPRRALLHGPGWIEERLAGLTFRISPTTFFQSSTAGAEVLVEAVREAAGDGRRLLDLYCGAGVLGLALAEAFEEVLGVEVVEEAVDDARANARRNGVAHARFVHGAVEQVAAGLQADVAVVDPPRSGLHPRAARWLAGAPGLRRLVYVACNPATLARDRPVLEQGGWRMESWEAIDLFPHTGHVEVVARFGRRGR